MPTIRRLLLLPTSLALLLLVAACGGGDDGPTSPPPLTDDAVYAAGWAQFGDGDFVAAEAQFRELLRRGALLAPAHDGLGWSFARRSDADSARTHFEQAVAAGADMLDIADQVQAGLAFALAASGQHAACLAAAGAVSVGWVFEHDDRFDHDAIILLTAVAHYALGDFAASLAAVQQLDAAFDADIETPAGRAALAARIEALQTDR